MSSPWEPRALKRLKAQPLPESSAAEDTPTQPCAATYGGASDLDSDDDDDDDDQRRRPTPAANGDQPPSAPPPAPPSAAPPPPSVLAHARKPAMADDEILKGAPRLAQHIRGPNKFNKVAAMCCGLLESNRVNRENAAAFFYCARGWCGGSTHAATARAARRVSPAVRGRARARDPLFT
jgi:hypothetical protein